MIHRNDFQLEFRPDYGFAEFDRLLQQLRDAIPALDVVEVLAALRLEGRDLDAEQLAAALDLTAFDTEIIEHLAAFGDRGYSVHEFGSVHIAEITAGSWVGMSDLTTYLLATRISREIEYWWQDENGGRGELGVRDRPLSMLETIQMVDAIFLAQEPYEVVSEDWRDTYLSDRTMLVHIRSDLYVELGRWYETAVAEWRAAHPEHK